MSASNLGVGPVMIAVEGLDKTFTLHNQGGTRIPVLSKAALTVRAGECVVLGGPSGSGKSSLMRSLYGNYLPSGGRLSVCHEGRMIDLATASPRLLLAVRRRTVGYVSQFLRVIPRVPTLDIVAEPLRDAGLPQDRAEAEAARLLTRLNLPERLWRLPPATFSGGEQQRVNIARGFARPFPILLLDEPTASLDADNRQVVVGLIGEALERGAAIVGIFHDRDVRDAVATRVLDVTRYRAAA
ncbi:MAG: phosphonate C-P lyase system protein PhnL [Inquilinaceae bacterium]